MVTPTQEEDNSDIEFGYCTEFFIKDLAGSLSEENACLLYTSRCV